MAWSENLFLEGKGSFRGVEFFVESAESTIGRRTVVHEYPGRDTPAVEDEGRVSRRFSLTCYVLGPEYDVDRDFLRTEFERKGPGRLVHPYWGEFNAQVVSPVRVRETTREGGIARFELELANVSDDALTLALPSLTPIVEQEADAAIEATAAEFEEDFSVSGVIEEVRSAAVSAIGTLTDGVREARAVASSAVSVVNDTASAINNLVEEASALIQAPLSLVSAIQGVAGAVYSGIVTIADEVATFDERFAAALTTGPLFGDFRADRLLQVFRDVTTDSASLVPVTSTVSASQKEVERQNQAALQTMYKRVAAIEGARALVQIDFNSRDVVTRSRDEVVERLNELLLDADDDVWSALVDLRDAFYARMNEIGQSLPTLVEHTPKATQPSLVIAYDLYGDATREAEIVGRNSISNPARVPGLQPLKVTVS
jgi:prophage DNA circulation protein